MTKSPLGDDTTLRSEDTLPPSHSQPGAGSVGPWKRYTALSRPRANAARPSAPVVAAIGLLSTPAVVMGAAPLTNCGSTLGVADCTLERVSPNAFTAATW